MIMSQHTEHKLYRTLLTSRESVFYTNRHAAWHQSHRALWDALGRAVAARNQLANFSECGQFLQEE